MQTQSTIRRLCFLLRFFFFFFATIRYLERLFESCGEERKGFSFSLFFVLSILPSVTVDTKGLMHLGPKRNWSINTQSIILNEVSLEADGSFDGFSSAALDFSRSMPL